MTTTVAILISVIFTIIGIFIGIIMSRYKEDSMIKSCKETFETNKFLRNELGEAYSELAHKEKQITRLYEKLQYEAMNYAGK